MFWEKVPNLMVTSNATPLARANGNDEAETVSMVKLVRSEVFV